MVTCANKQGDFIRLVHVFHCLLREIVQHADKICIIWHLIDQSINEINVDIIHVQSILNLFSLTINAQTFYYQNNFSLVYCPF